MNDFQEQAKNWLRNVVKQNPDKIKAGVEKAGDLVDKQTGGKYAEKVDAVQQKVGGLRRFPHVRGRLRRSAVRRGPGEWSRCGWCRLARWWRRAGSRGRRRRSSRPGVPAGELGRLRH